MVQSKTRKHFVATGPILLQFAIYLDQRVLVSTRAIAAAAFYYYFLDWLAWYVALSALLWMREANPPSSLPAWVLWIHHFFYTYAMCLWLPTLTKEFGYIAYNSLESMNMIEFLEILQEAEVVNGM